MSLADQTTGMMDGLGQSELENLGLKATFQEIFNTKTQNVIQLHLVFGEDTHENQTAEEDVSFEKTLGVFVVQHEKSTSNLADLGQSQLDSPYFALVAETKFTDQFQFLNTE